MVPNHANLTSVDVAPGAAASQVPFASDAPTIEAWEDAVEVMGSLQRPKKVVIRGSDGEKYIFLCKPKDDLRKDARMMDFMTSVNRLLHKSANCRRRRLVVQCYAVTPPARHSVWPASAQRGAKRVAPKEVLLGRARTHPERR